jgi:hypothetical protein
VLRHPERGLVPDFLYSADLFALSDLVCV